MVADDTGNLEAKPHNINFQTSRILEVYISLYAQIQISIKILEVQNSRILNV
jgi:hypothetical protein